MTQAPIQAAGIGQTMTSTGSGPIGVQIPQSMMYQSTEQAAGPSSDTQALLLDRESQRGSGPVGVHVPQPPPVQAAGPIQPIPPTGQPPVQGAAPSGSPPMQAAAPLIIRPCRSQDIRLNPRFQDVRLNSPGPPLTPPEPTLQQNFPFPANPTDRFLWLNRFLITDIRDINIRRRLGTQDSDSDDETVTFSRVSPSPPSRRPAQLSSPDREHMDPDARASDQLPLSRKRPRVCNLPQQRRLRAPTAQMGCRAADPAPPASTHPMASSSVLVPAADSPPPESTESLPRTLCARSDASTESPCSSSCESLQ